MNKIMKKDIVAGLGEIGLPILKLISKKELVVLEIHLCLYQMYQNLTIY